MELSVGYNSKVVSSLVIILDEDTFDDGGLEEGPVRVKNPLELLLGGDSRVLMVVVLILAKVVPDVVAEVEVAVEVFLS